MLWQERVSSTSILPTIMFIPWTDITCARQFQRYRMNVGTQLHYYLLGLGESLSIHAVGIVTSCRGCALADDEGTREQVSDSGQRTAKSSGPK